MENTILIAFYSWSGNTRKIAETIAHKTGGTIFEIEPVQPYPSDYREAVTQAKKEIHSHFRPALKTIPQTHSYTTIFLGSPIWWHTMAPPLATFINRFDLSTKTVIPFYTHGGGGGGTYEKDITELCRNSTIQEGFGEYNSGGSKTTDHICSWLKSIGLQSKKEDEKEI